MISRVAMLGDERILAAIRRASSRVSRTLNLAFSLSDKIETGQNAPHSQA
jgi:hypothetical protein